VFTRSRLLAAPLAVAAPLLASAGEPDQVRYAQLTIHERVITRVPRMIVPVPRPVRWREKRGPACVPAAALAGALVNAPDQIDLVLRGGQRLRARLDRGCRALDFYSGFYLRPAPDGAICAERDAVRARSGATCGIRRFRRLVAAER
jgi:hypothetical protein